jgi:hypothetical protein
MKHRALQNEYLFVYFRFSLLGEEKIRLEYDLKQRSEALGKQVMDLRNENENLQIALNEK